MTVLALTNVGLRLVDRRPPAKDVPELLRELRRRGVVPSADDPAQRELVDRGLARVEGGDVDLAALELRYRRNPLEHLTRVVFEYTTSCNFRCAHCRNGGLAGATEGKPQALAKAAEVVLPLGIDRFDFIGGEVSLFGRGWLELVRELRRLGARDVCLLTNGWFLGRSSFQAAGECYPDDRAYLRALAAAGLTHLTFSLDGPEQEHEQSRRAPGIYSKILGAFDRVRDEGLRPQVSLLIQPHREPRSQLAWLSSVASALYPSTVALHPERRAELLLGDPLNYVSNFIDVGSGAALRHGLDAVARVPDRLLRCKALYRPAPSLRIQASGEVSLCPLVDAGEGYGNVHAPGGLLPLLNHLQDAVPYRLHATGEIARYREFVDPRLFGDRLDHACSLRAVVTMIARRMVERAVAEDDAAAIGAINLEVAKKSGYHLV